MKPTLTIKAIAYSGLAALTLFAFSVFSTAYGSDRSTKHEVAVDEMSPGEEPTPTQFLNKAIGSGHREVEVSEIAMEKASSAGVRDFAKMLANDHGALNMRLESIARTKNLPLDPAPPADALGGIEGAKFDAAYLDFMIEGHKKSIALFTAARDSGDAAVREVATETLPKLEHHLMMAQELKAENDKIMASMPED